MDSKPRFLSKVINPKPKRFLAVFLPLLLALLRLTGSNRSTVTLELSSGRFSVRPCPHSLLATARFEFLRLHLIHRSLGY